MDNGNLWGGYGTVWIDRCAMIDSAGFVGVRQIIDILTVEPIFDMLVDQEKNNERGIWK